MKNEIDHWSDPDFQISQGKYSPAAKTLMDRAALEFGESHPDLRIVIFNPSMILGNFRESLQSNLGLWKANADLDCYAKLGYFNAFRCYARKGKCQNSNTFCKRSSRLIFIVSRANVSSGIARFSLHVSSHLEG